MGSFFFTSAHFKQLQKSDLVCGSDLLVVGIVRKFFWKNLVVVDDLKKDLAAHYKTF